MIFYLIRHKATQEFMPELERGRGYSHWNPGKVPTTEVFRPRKLVGTPRLFLSRGSAVRTIAAWFNNPNAYMSYSRSSSSFGSDDPDLTVKDDGRKKEDLEVVEVAIIDRAKFTGDWTKMLEGLANE